MESFPHWTEFFWQVVPSQDVDYQEPAYRSRTRSSSSYMHYLVDLERKMQTCIWSKKPSPENAPRQIQAAQLKQQEAYKRQNKAGNRTTRCDRNTPEIRYWHPPPTEALKLNVDASWVKGKPTCTVGCVSRDSQARMVFGTYRRIHASSH